MVASNPLQAVAPDAFAQVLRRALTGALVGGLLIATLEFAVTRVSIPALPPEQLAWLARLSVHWVLASLPLGIAVAVLERYSPLPQPSWRGYAVAVLLGAGAGALVLALHGKFVDPAISGTAVGFDMDLLDRFLYGMWQLAFWGSAGAMLHASSLRRRRAAVALHADELQRLRSERRLAEERLSALHAQVEPEFVLSTLSTVERLYETILQLRTGAPGRVHPVPALRDAAIAPAELDDRPRLMPPPRGVRAHARRRDRRRGRDAHGAGPARGGHAGTARNLVCACAATSRRDAPNAKLGPGPPPGSRRRAPGTIESARRTARQAGDRSRRAAEDYTAADVARRRGACI